MMFNQFSFDWAIPARFPNFSNHYPYSDGNASTFCRGNSIWINRFLCCWLLEINSRPLVDLFPVSINFVIFHRSQIAENLNIVSMAPSLKVTQFIQGQILIEIWTQEWIQYLLSDDFVMIFAHFMAFQLQANFNSIPIWNYEILKWVQEIFMRFM